MIERYVRRNQPSHTVVMSLEHWFFSIPSSGIVLKASALVQISNTELSASCISFTCPILILTGSIGTKWGLSNKERGMCIENAVA